MILNASAKLLDNPRFAFHFAILTRVRPEIRQITLIGEDTLSLGGRYRFDGTRCNRNAWIDDDPRFATGRYAKSVVGDFRHFGGIVQQNFESFAVGRGAIVIGQ